MTDPIEAVARAICLANEYGPDEFDYADNEPLWRRYISDAQYAIAAYTQAVAGEAAAWRYEIQYGPEGEENYAWVYCGKDLVATMKTHHAIAICKAMNAAPPAIPAGWKLVPVEPTMKMISAGISQRHDEPVPEAWKLATENIYRAMLEAAPEAP